MKSIEDHLADFLLLMRDPAMKDYRRRCLAHWRDVYGDAMATKVEGMVKARWQQKPRSESSKEPRYDLDPGDGSGTALLDRA